MHYYFVSTALKENLNSLGIGQSEWFCFILRNKDNLVSNERSLDNVLSLPQKRKFEELLTRKEIFFYT